MSEKTRESMSALGKRIRTLVEKGENMLASAAVCAKEARDRFETGEKDGCATWGQWWTKRTGLSDRRGRQLIAIGRSADPAEAALASKKATAEQVARHRASKAEIRISSQSEPEPKIDLFAGTENHATSGWNGGEGIDNDETVWSSGLLHRAEAAESAAAFEQFWTKFPITEEHVNAAKRAAEAWAKLVEFLRSNLKDAQEVSEWPVMPEFLDRRNERKATEPNP
jgi:hypothetical protein